MNANELWRGPLWSEAEPSTETKWQLINQYTDELLRRSAWAQLPDALLTPQERTQWETYRETLLAIPYSYVNPDDVVIPDPPAISTNPPSVAILAARERRKAARGVVKAIPNWATWTQADWQTYFDANLSDAQVDLVTSLAAARVAMKRQNLVILNLAKVITALRDQEMSDLPDG